MKKTVIIDGQKRTIDIDEFDLEAEKAGKAIRGHNVLRPQQNWYKQRRLQNCFPYNDESVSRLVQK